MSGVLRRVYIKCGTCEYEIGSVRNVRAGREREREREREDNFKNIPEEDCSDGKLAKKSSLLFLTGGCAGCGGATVRAPKSAKKLSCWVEEAVVAGAKSWTGGS